MNELKGERERTMNQGKQTIDQGDRIIAPLIPQQTEATDLSSFPVMKSQATSS